MKHFTLLGLVALLSLPMQGQLFESGFEDWTGSTPDGWFGIRTNIAASNVIQVSENVHGGSFAVRLQNTSTTHQRFTTQDQTVIANTTYTVNFWARGQGEVRLGIYDGRPGNGYSPYTDYTVISGDATWQEVTLSIAAAVNASNAQFILSVRSTVAPEHLVFDDVTITGGSVNPPIDVTIQEIQETTDIAGVSPLNGTAVTTTGVVTGLVGGNNPGFFIQGGGGAWSGIFVFIDPTGLAIRGDSVSVTGTVTEFNGQTQLASVANVVNLGSGYSLPQTVITTAEASTEPFESVQVTVEAASCTAAGSFGHFTVNDGTGPALVDDVIHAYPFTVGQVYNITGVLQYAFSEWRILPREDADVQVVTSVGELTGADLSVFPNPTADQLTISLGNWNERVEYTFADATGRVVGGDVLMQERGTVDVSHLTNGLYILTLRSGSSVWSTRVMVQH
jgi:hypothetical protein